MFIQLLVFNFLIALLVSYLVVIIFKEPIRKILKRIISEDLHHSWVRYVVFAVFVVGFSGGIRLWEIDRYITPDKETGKIIELTKERWVLEIYRTIIGTLQSDTWMLLVFFLFALIAFVLVKGFELKSQKN